MQYEVILHARAPQIFSALCSPSQPLISLRCWFLQPCSLQRNIKERGARFTVISEQDSDEGSCQKGRMLSGLHILPSILPLVGLLQTTGGVIFYLASCYARPIFRPAGPYTCSDCTTCISGAFQMKISSHYTRLCGDKLRQICVRYSRRVY